MKEFEVTREKVIRALEDGLKDDTDVYAFWLEGSDGTGTVDMYSDVDIYLDVEDGQEDRIYHKSEKILSDIGKIDYSYILKHPHPKLRQRFYHLEGSSEYMLIDFCIQLHSRDRDESAYLAGNNIELPTVVFDKAGVIRYKERNGEQLAKTLENRLYDLKNMYRQHSRVIKYVKRGLYLEAFAYYQKYVVNPLVELIRIRYTPDYYYFYLVHISSHLPNHIVNRLESFCRVSSLEDIETKTLEAEAWFEEILHEIEKLQWEGIFHGVR